jgi:hypothetical protein
VDELIEKADGFAGVFPGIHFLSLLEFFLWVKDVSLHYPQMLQDHSAKRKSVQEDLQ